MLCYLYLNATTLKHNFYYKSAFCIFFWVEKNVVTKMIIGKIEKINIAYKYRLFCVYNGINCRMIYFLCDFRTFFMGFCNMDPIDKLC